MTISKTLFRSGPYADFFSQGVQVGNSLHMAGQVGTDAAGVAPNDLVEQMSLAYGHVQNVLAAVSYTHLRAHETKANLVCRLLLFEISPYKGPTRRNSGRTKQTQKRKHRGQGLSDTLQALPQTSP